MESIQPKTRVPEEWIHPDLKRQMAGRCSVWDASKYRLDILETQCRDIENVVLHLQQGVGEKKSQLEKLDQRRREIAEEIEGDKKQMFDLHHIYERICDQLTFHKTMGQHEFYDLWKSVENVQSSHCALSVSNVNTWGQLTSCFKVDDEARRLFFERYASFFSAANGDSTNVGGIAEIYFFHEMCLMETEKSFCKNIVCPYWHTDQLARVKWSFARLISRALTRIEGNRNICDAADFFGRLHVTMAALTDIVDAVRIQRDAVNCIATIGWAAGLIGEEQTTAWSAPLLSRTSCMSLQHVELLLRDPKERSCWQHILQSTSDAISTATTLFQQQADSLSWRCLMRVSGSTTERLLWLAARGIALFSTSPPIRLTYIWALLKSGCVVSDCVDACRESAQVLSTQAATSTFSQQDLQWSENAARYIAYMIAMTCVWAAERDPDAAIELLVWTVEVPGRICLLPLALQNLTMLLIVLRQTKKLEGINDLPLASISDVAFALSEYFPGRPQEECGKLLSRQLDLLMGCTAAGIDKELMEFMRSTVHLSLMRVFSADVRMVDQILARSQMQSVRGMSEVWLEYLRFVERHDGAVSLVSLVHSLFEHCHSPLLMVHLVRFFAFHGGDVKTMTDIFVQRFAAMRHISLDTVRHLALEESPSLPPDEWIPFLILYSHSLGPQERLELLLRVPVSLYCEVIELVVLLWVETLQVAIQVKDEKIFRHCTLRGLQLLSEPFFHSFSPIDYYFEDMISFAHVASLMVYRAVPVLLGASYQLTEFYRRIVLDVSEELHVVHPYLLAAE